MKFVTSKRVLVTKTFKQSVHYSKYFSELSTKKINPSTSKYSLREIRLRGMFSY